MLGDMSDSSTKINQGLVHTPWILSPVLMHVHTLGTTYYAYACTPI